MADQYIHKQEMAASFKFRYKYKYDTHGHRMIPEEDSEYNQEWEERKSKNVKHRPRSAR